MNEQQRNRLVLNLKLCIEDTFTSSNWDELAYRTNGKSIIYGHSRLIRSLNFGDDDYGSCIFDVLEELIDQDPANLQIISDYAKFPEWLKEHKPEEFTVVYGHTKLLLDKTTQISVTNLFEVHQYIERINRSIETDPALAVGSTKELLESVLKTIILAEDGENAEKEDLPKLLKRVQKLLNLDPSSTDPNAKGADIVKRTLSNLSQVVLGLNELRNLYGTGHGQTRKSSITPRHARLVVGAGATLATFLMETFEIKTQQTKDQF